MEESKRHTILVVDDEEPIRNMVRQMLELFGYICICAADTTEARLCLKNNDVHLLLCDINMPGESGLEFVKDVISLYPDTATVMVTGIDDPNVAEDAIAIGAYDYIIKPFDHREMLISVTNALSRRRLEHDNRIYRMRLESLVEERTAELQLSEARLRGIFEAAEHVAFVLAGGAGENAPITEFSRGAEKLTGYTSEEVLGRPLSVLGLPHVTELLPEALNRIPEASSRSAEITFIRKGGEEVFALLTVYPLISPTWKVTSVLYVAIDISERKRAERGLEESMARLREALGGTIEAIAKTMETRDPYTAGHEQRVAELACAIGDEIGLSPDRMEGLKMAGMVHDLGKVSIPVAILSKPGRISKIELELIKTHSVTGYEILKEIKFPWPIALMVLQHHERIDGSGYPYGIMGDALLLESRILAVADVVEAMSSHRPYRPALGIEASLAEIEGKKGVLYDKGVVDVCLRLFREKGFRFSHA